MKFQSSISIYFDLRKAFLQTFSIAMAGSRSAPALISICILLCLSGLGDCRVPFQSEEVVGEKEQSVHLLLPSEKEEFNEIAIETLPLERPHLRGNDGIFQGERSRPHLLLLSQKELLNEIARGNLRLDRSLLRENDGIFEGERSRGFRFGRPGGCHHGKFNRRGGQRKSEHMPFPLEFPDVQAESRDFHPRMDRPLLEKSDFGPGFSNGEWRQQSHGHPEEEKGEKENEHMPFSARGVSLESFFHLFPGHGDPAEFHPREDEFRPLSRQTEFVHVFSNGGEGRQHRDETEERERENAQMPFPGEQTEPFARAFPVEESTEFHSRVAEFLSLPRHRDFDQGFPGGEGRQPRHGHGEEEKENEHFPFPTKGERTESFTNAFPVQAESIEFRPKVEEFLPSPPERDFEHGFPGGEGRQPRQRHAHGEEEKGEEQQGKGPYVMEKFKTD